MNNLGRLSLTLASLATAASAYHWPDPKFDAIEALLYEQSPEPEGSVSLTGRLNSCVPASNGEHIAAEWMRFTYHDMATHNAEEGTGGLDASLYYELDRAENVGNGMNVTSLDFVDFPGKYVSKSDIIAIGTVLAVAECGGPTIPLRMGRVDAVVAGPAGVPKPQEDLASHIASFRRQGFTQSEMIGLVACGHTFGGVRTPDFPDIVPATANGSELVVSFDSTPKFDNAVVTEYLAGTTKNPLVVHPNHTITSDLRIFSSDSNVTMKSMSSPEAYSKTCGDLLERMINSVPKGVQLSEVIKPLPVKVDAVQLSPHNGTLNLKAMLRLATKNSNRKVTMFWENRTGGKCAGNVCSAPVVSTNDTTTTLFQRAGMSPQKYRFNAPINVTTSVSKFWFEVDENDGNKPQIHDNEGTGYEIQQDRVLFVPELSKNNLNKNFTVVVAVRNDVTPSRVYANVMWRVDEPKDLTVDFALAPEISSIPGYIYYKASVNGPNFMFDLFSVVDGTTYSEDGRDSRNIESADGVSLARRSFVKREKGRQLRREWLARKARN